MAAALLKTKFRVPAVRSELVSRPRLITRLNEGLHRRLTLVSAPAGFGKTTLLAEWVHAVGARHASPLRVAWVSLDEGDNEPRRFWTYVIAALRTIQPIAAATAFEAALAALQSPHPPPAEELLTGMINEIAEVPDSCALVLDDYHAI